MQPDVVLLTSDPDLARVITGCQPPDTTLQLARRDELEAAMETAAELWLDLDECGGTDLPTGSGRRVYFHERDRTPPKGLPPGTYIRKPCHETVARVLWANALDNASQRPSTRPGCLPVWITEFHELGLRELCRRCVARLPARLGYEHVSLYLCDQQAGLFTLVETTHQRPIDLTVRLDDQQRQLMAAVARSGRLLHTSDAAGEWNRRNLRVARGRQPYRDGDCLVAPLVSGGRIWGLLNFSERRITPVTESGLALQALFTFLGRSFRYARAYERARTEARVDPLTGLYNKRWMIETVTREIRRVQRYGAPLSLAVVDLDGLKCVNDQHGHLAGDSALRHVSGRISAGLRELDSAARIGGDEFVVLLPNTDLPGAQHVGRRILTAIRKDAAQHKDVPLTISASIGIAQWEPGWQPSDLIDAADVAMYRAKQRGRNQIVCRPTSGGAGKSPGMPAPGGAAVNATARLHG